MGESDYIHAGDPVSISARAWNSFVDNVRMVREQRVIFGVPADEWFPSPALIPMIVTERNQVAPDIGENVFIDQLYQQPASAGSAFAFKAKPYKSGATTLSALDGDEVYIDASLIGTVIFTGQLILVSFDAPVKPQTFTYNGKSFDVQGQVISNGFGNEWVGTVVLVRSTTTVDINFVRTVTNSAATRPTTCRIPGTNDTDTGLVTGQQVVCDYMGCDPNGGPNVNYGRWRISEYKCMVPQ